MSKINRDSAPEIQVRGETICLVRKSDYVRLLREAGENLVDAAEFARSSIGRDLRGKRKKAGLSQAQVAAKAGIRLETLSRIENGRGNPTVETVRRILKALGG